MLVGQAGQNQVANRSCWEHYSSNKKSIVIGHEQTFFK